MKKVLSVFCVLLILGSNSLNAVELDFQLTECEVYAVNIHNDFIEEGMSHADAYALSDFLQWVCEQI